MERERRDEMEKIFEEGKMVGKRHVDSRFFLFMMVEELFFYMREIHSGIFDSVSLCKKRDENGRFHLYLSTTESGFEIMNYKTLDLFHKNCGLLFLVIGDALDELINDGEKAMN